MTIQDLVLVTDAVDRPSDRHRHIAAGTIRVRLLAFLAAKPGGFRDFNFEYLLLRFEFSDTAIIVHLPRLSDFLLQLEVSSPVARERLDDMRQFASVVRTTYRVGK
ncbi:MAG: hypothetical protein VX346_06660 [Planctomycetota bacterium]|nr:hypothetical protein [Planctomycetota bacterium]